MNIMQSWTQVLSSPGESHPNTAYKQSLAGLFFGYILPLSLITPIMVSITIGQHPKLFMDIQPGNRLFIIGLGVFLAQVISVPVMAWITKNLALMVGVRPQFSEALTVIAIAVTPLWLVSVFYLIPNLPFNLVMHAAAAVVACGLLYLGIRNIFQVNRRGAAAMLTLATIATAWIGYGVLLIYTLMSWNQVQFLQFGQ